MNDNEDTDEFDFDMDIDMDIDFDFDVDIDFDIKNAAKKDLTFFHKDEYTRNFISKLKTEELGKVIPDLPQKKEILHILTEGEFSSVAIISHIIESMSGSVNFSASMLGINRNSFLKILEYYNNKKIISISLICDKDIMKLKHDGVLEMIESKSKGINLRVAFIRNHTKITIIENKIDYYVIISSANYSTNRKFEQYAILNSMELYIFYKTWFEEHLEYA